MTDLIVFSTNCILVHIFCTNIKMKKRYKNKNKILLSQNINKIVIVSQ